MITVKGRCMKPRSRSIHLKQKQGRSTCRAQTRFLLCLQQDFEVEVWLSLQTIFFSMNLRVYYVISKHIGLIDVQGACENETPLLCPCFHRPSESIAIIFFQSSSVTGTRHVEIRQSTNPRNWHGNLKADHSTAISNRNLLFKGVHVSIDWRSSRSPRILPAHPVQCARTEGWLVDLTAFTSRHETACVYWKLIQVFNTYYKCY